MCLPTCFIVREPFLPLYSFPPGLMYINNNKDQSPRERVKENGGSGSGTNVARKPARGDLVIERILTAFVYKVQVRR